MKKMRMLFLLFAAACAASAQTPVITKIAVDTAATDNASFRVLVSASPSSWLMLRYGTSSGVYPYNTKSVQATDIALSVGGLAPNTTYYILATARPNPNDDTNICASAACGAREITVTTAAGTLQTPIPANVWKPAHPDTSGYTVVPMSVQNAATGECGAKQSVTSPDGWSVSAGDLMRTVLSKVGYGTVLEFDQGAACVVAYDSPLYFGGYRLAHKPLDPKAGGNLNSPNHRYIVMRTKAVNSADFPPYGVRITPAWSSRLAKFYIQNPTPKNIATGQVFDGEVGDAGIHHFWFENLEFAPSPSYTAPADALDPTAFQYFFRLGSSYQSANNTYLVLDRLYMHGWPPPFRQYTAIELGGNYQAMLSCYLSNIQTWRMSGWPMTAGGLDAAGTTLSIPQNTYRFQASTPMLGMTGPATATLTGALPSYSGTVVGNLYKDHLEIQYTATTGTTAGIQCQGCTALATATPATPANAYPLFTGSISGGVFSKLSWNVNCETCTSQYFSALGVQFSDLQAPGGPYTFDNNYMDGVGLGFYVDAQTSSYAHDDLTYTHNHNIWPKNYFVRDPDWIGWRFNVRQHWESKRGHRYNLSGNVFSYAWSYQNDGPAIFLSGRPNYNPQALSSGISDVVIKSNIIRHSRTGIGCGSISAIDGISQDSDPQPTSRITISNNLMYDMGRYLYCDTTNCPGFQSAYFELRPTCQNVTIKNNTGGLMQGDIPAWLYLGGGDMLGNYLEFENNILYMSMGASEGSPGTLWGAIIGDWPGPSSGYTGHDVKPGTSYTAGTNSSFVNVPPFKTMLDNTFVNIGQSVKTGNYVWKNNVGIAGYVGAANQMTNMTSSQLAAIVAQMPQGDQYIAGGTIAGREKAIGFTDVARFNYEITGRGPLNDGKGVDFNQLFSDAGMVTEVRTPLVAPTAALFKYKAPDTRACYVDMSKDGGLSWTRTNDGGGGQARTLRVTGLTQGSTYMYRILCYYEQANDGVLYTEYESDQNTSGSFRTPSAGIGKVLLEFTLPPNQGAAQMAVELQPLDGSSAVTHVCLESPCSFTAPVGDYTLTSRYLNPANVQVATGSAKTVSVR